MPLKLFSHLFRSALIDNQGAGAFTKKVSPSPLPYSWILTNKLAVGPMPISTSHWNQLEDAGFRSRFSCCYSYESELVPVPTGWRSASISLPDHRRQEPLDIDRLVSALTCAEALLSETPPLYLHCLAGIERSPLIAVGLTARARNLTLLEALDWVRRCHPPALPIYTHLDILESALQLLVSS